MRHMKVPMFPNPVIPMMQFTCNRCVNESKFFDGFFRCKDNGCHYNVCNKCAIVAGFDPNAQDEGNLALSAVEP